MFFGVSFAAWNSANIKAISIPEETGEHDTEAISTWNPQNIEIDLLVEELRQQKEKLQQRENHLNELAARLQAEREELNQLTQKVTMLQKDFDLNVTRVTEEETPNLKKLARTYANMTPEGAAGIFKQLDDTVLVKIMLFMKEAETSPILELMAAGGDEEAKRVADLSERLRLSINPTKKSNP
ncbi:MAG: hypothetical protein SFY81_09195 [Verrucomicrobiota bacterium]|nr:hypothetical protein [Verrucomicrobiota bacterium]